MAGRIGVNGRRIAVAATVLVAALMLWAWWDGGEQPLQMLTAPTLLPAVVQ